MKARFLFFIRPIRLCFRRKRYVYACEGKIKRTHGTTQFDRLYSPHASKLMDENLSVNAQIKIKKEISNLNLHLKISGNLVIHCAYLRHVITILTTS